jgi:putative nucleotidyltransferase with HDIG domain
MSASLSSSQVKRSQENYHPLLDLASKLTGARHAAFLPLDGPAGLLALDTSPDFPAVYWEAAREVAQNPMPLLFQSRSQRSFQPLLAVPVRHRDDLLGVMIVSHRPQRPFNRDDLSLVALLAEDPALVADNLAYLEETTVNLLESIQALVQTLEARDHYTGQHSRRVTEIALRFARELGLPQPQLLAVRTAGYLHDIGKVGISDRLLLKPGLLTQAEIQIIRTHPAIGAKIVVPLGLKPQESQIILHHHERWDGKGYPRGLAGEEIPFLCRLVALADVFDALTSDRPYRPRYTVPEVLDKIRVRAGSHFDPDLTPKFVKLIYEQT